MAEIVVSALLTVVFEKLTSAVLTKVGRSKKDHSDLDEWKRSLKQIRGLLNDASQKEITDENVKDWLNRFHHLAYDIDDILDSLATDHAMHPELTQEAETSMVTKVRKLIPTCCTTSSSNSNDTEMHAKLNDITTKLRKLYDERENLGLTVKDGRSKDKNRSYQTSLFDPAGIVGREDEKQVLLQELLADDEPAGVNQSKFSIVPIVGMGGIGKTTLARLLYNEPKVKEHFDIRAWVCVSDEESGSFDSFNISKLIFESVAAEKKKFENLDKLQEALKDQLNGKRFLLVLDDVWSEKIQDWRTLVPPFHSVAPGSKVIITTRKRQWLQKLPCTPYNLTKLSHNDALSLFAHYALGANNFDSHQELGEYGEGIVKKCDGLPLALQALGSLLRNTPDEEKWKEVLESEIWTLKNAGDDIFPALRLSYLELSACLKQLFAYTCLFPKDCVFEKEDLILLWMAEGFLHGTMEKSMEVLGEECFDELLSRSFFQRLPNDESLFMMHDLMNDLATSVAEEFFIRVDIEMKKEIIKETLEKSRHMSFVREEFLASKKFEAFERAKNLRSFLAVPVVVRNSWEEFYLPNKVLDDLLPRLPLLRVLSLSKLEIYEVPKSVGDLKHLRYLNLSETRIAYLPENVCDLFNLQTLIVFGCHELSKLPDIIKLKNLRHLDLRDTPLLENMPLGIGQMKSLQTLSKIVIGGVNEFAINRFKNLKNLRRRVCIHVLDKLQNSVQAREAKLFQMKLSELVVEWSDAFDGSRNKMLEKEVLDVLKPHSQNCRKLEILSYVGTEFPKWVGDPSFRRLTVVRMYKCRNCVFLPPLGQLSSLKKLTIESMDEVEKVGTELLGTGPAAFPSLENLEFRNMAGWEVWSANAGVAVFPCLEELWIEDCPKLVKVSLEALPSLRVLKVEKCGDVLLTSLVGVASSSVTKLIISNISGLSDEVWGGVVQYLRALEELQISFCYEIRNMWESEEACKVLVNLNKLFIFHCENLERIGGGEKEEGSNLFLTSLRMLDIDGCKNLKHLTCPNNIEELKIENCYKLKHLRCPNSIEELKIWSCENLEHLTCPNSIEKLNITGCKNLKHLSCPNSIEELTIERRGGGGGWQKLKSLHISGCNSQVLEEELEKQVLTINNNTNMLQFLIIHGWKNLKSIMELNCFIQLTTLHIYSCHDTESFPELQNLTLLTHLEIIYCRSMDASPPSSDGDGGGRGVWPPNLHSLRIGYLKRPISKWAPHDFPASLVDLRLFGGSEEEDDVSGGSQLSHILPSSLTKLGLCGFYKMETISSEGLQHLTSLQHLYIWGSPELKDLPETLSPSLLSLVIGGGCSEDLKEKMSRSGSYWPRISHIPKVFIR